MSLVSRNLVAGLLCASCVAIGATARPTFTHAAVVGATSAPATNPFDDQFNAPTLNGKWKGLLGLPPKVLGQPPKLSLTAHRGYLRLNTEIGKDMGGKVASASLLVQKAPTGNYEITTYVELTPTQDFQQAGLVVYGSGTNFCKLVYVYNDQPPNKGASIAMRLNPQYPPAFFPVTPSSRTLGYFLQLDVQVDKKGVTYTGYVSTDGKANNWHKVHSYPNSTVTPAYIGVYAVNGADKNASTHPIPADFDFFQERPLAAGATGALPVAKF